MEARKSPSEKANFLRAMQMIHFAIGVAIGKLKQPSAKSNKISDKINRELYTDLMRIKSLIEEYHPRAVNLDNKQKESKKDRLISLSIIKTIAADCLKSCSKILTGEDAKAIPEHKEKRIYEPEEGKNDLDDLIDPVEFVKAKNADVHHAEESISAALNKFSSGLKKEEIGTAFAVLKELTHMRFNAGEFEIWLKNLPQNGFPTMKPIGALDDSPQATVRKLGND